MKTPAHALESARTRTFNDLSFIERLKHHSIGKLALSLNPGERTGREHRLVSVRQLDGHSGVFGDTTEVTFQRSIPVGNILNEYPWPLVARTHMSVGWHPEYGSELPPTISAAQTWHIDSPDGQPLSKSSYETFGTESQRQLSLCVVRNILLEARARLGAQ